MMRDITERKALEGQFLQAQKMEAVGLLAGGVAHEVNNLLTVMLGYTEVIAEGLHSDTDRASAAKVIKAGHRAAAITKQLLAFSRKQVLRTSVVDVNAIVADVSQLLGPLIGEHIHLAVVAEPELPAVRVDAGQVEQVLMNLAMNARDAMPDGGRLTIATADVELDGTVTFLRGPATPGRYVRVSVVDTGVGMTEETRRRAIDPFFTTKDVGKGSGLGLSTVYGIVKQSGGYLGIDSELGRGSTFSVYLPQAVTEAAGRLGDQPAAGPAAGAGAAQPPSE
jgi:signal transduction histidine kinase